MNYIKKLMNKNFLLLLSWDILLIFLSFYSSILFRFDFHIPLEVKKLLTYQNFIVLIVLKIFCFRIFALYRGMWRYTSVWDMMNIVKANILSTIMLTAIILFSIGFNDLSRSLIIIDFIICTGMISISRLGIRMFFYLCEGI
jgi:Predicted nucleoside-diphosphate sugar epimerases